MEDHIKSLETMMPKSHLKLPFVFTMALLVAACARGPIDPKTNRVSDVENVPLQKLVAGDYNNELNARPPVAVTRLTDAGLKNVLRKLAQENGRPGRQCNRGQSLRECVDNLKSAAATGKFRGLSGISGRAFLDVAGTPGNVNTTRDVVVRGRILEKCLHETNIDLPGYYYDAGSNHLRLCVIMTTETFPNPNAPAMITYQYFHVEAENAFVDQRGNDPDNIFEAAADATGLVMRATPENAKFQYKLYAAGDVNKDGRADNIEIINYWEAKASANQPQPPWKKFTKNTPKPPEIAAFFEKDKDACIDMMFEGEPPVTLPSNALAGQFYCLGRCKNPPIVNTK